MTRCLLRSAFGRTVVLTASLSVTALLSLPAAAAPASPRVRLVSSVSALARASAAGSVSAQTTALNYAPSSRTLHPTAVQSTSGSVTNSQNVLSGNDTRIAGSNSAVVLDFGEEVGGLITLSFDATSDAGQRVGLAFSESSLYTGTTSDASNGGSGADGAIYASATAGGTYTMPASALRGGFRYLTVFLSSSGWVDLNRVTLQYTPSPDLADPSVYPNYFLSNDDLLNRIWYAGAYTVQTNTISSNQGRVWGAPASGWDNSATVGVGTSVLTDGAKRDRTVWPGDLGISVPTSYVSTDALSSTRNALQTLYNAQKSTGELPFAGPQVSAYGSDTYHIWTLLGTSLYYSYSGDRTWLDSVWSKFQLGMTFAENQIDANGLLSVPGAEANDWARGDQGGENIEANALLYAALLGGADLATAEGDATTAGDYRSRAATLKSAANTRLWDAAYGMYRDNATSTLYPQDGNSLAVWYGLVDSPAKSTAITGNLAARWNSFGAQTPEKGNNIATFPGSMEVQAHFAANDDQRGLDLIRREWGYMLDSPIGTKSTFWEGYKADGSFDYNGAYMSLSHGWATGPTSALTFDVLGIAPDRVPGGYRFEPHPGDLTSVEGRITMPQGAVDAAWSRDVAAGTFTASLTSPAGTSGLIAVPKLGGGNVTVSVNGAVVWSAGGFAAQSGITGGSQDKNYVYLTGVAPGSYSIAATGVGGPAELPAGYTRCAGEGETCAVPGTGVVAYGAGAYLYKTVTSGTACTTAAFGSDPADGVLKSCYLAPTGGPSGYSACAAENAQCAFTGPRQVAYGANGAFKYLLLSGGTGCTNAVFEDPISGVPKQCYLAPDGAPVGGWTKCADEGAICAAVPGQPVAFGADGAFSYSPATGNTACNTTNFGDPVKSVLKSCYLRTGSPSGFASLCAAENSTCTVAARRTVAYGAAGRFTYKTFAADTPCTSAAFGDDPLFGASKSCYLTP